jgi:hypothetical protein
MPSGSNFLISHLCVHRISLGGTRRNLYGYLQVYDDYYEFIPPKKRLSKGSIDHLFNNFTQAVYLHESQNRKQAAEA